MYLCAIMLQSIISDREFHHDMLYIHHKIKYLTHELSSTADLAVLLGSLELCFTIEYGLIRTMVTDHHKQPVATTNTIYRRRFLWL